MLTLQQATNELEFRPKKNLQKTQIYLLISMNVYKSLPFFNVNVTLENRVR